MINLEDKYLFLSLKKVLDEINQTIDLENLNELQARLNEAIETQKQKIADLDGEIIIIRYSESEKILSVEKGNKLEYEVKGSIYNSMTILEQVPCTRVGTKKFNNLVYELENKYGATISNTTMKYMKAVS